MDVPEAADVDDQGIVRGPALGGVDLPGGCGVQGVSAQAVDGLRGEGHQAAVSDDFSGLAQGGFFFRCRFCAVGVYVNQLCLHDSSSLAAFALFWLLQSHFTIH